MIRLLRPQINGPLAAAGAWSPDDWHDRLMKYVPVEIAGAYPIIENIVSEHTKNGKSIIGFSPLSFAWCIFAILLLLNLGFLHRAYKTRVGPTARAWLEIPHIIFSTLAFMLWTYAIRSTIWLPLYDADLVLALTIIFGLAAALYTPTVTTQQASESGIIPAASPPPTHTPPNRAPTIPKPI
jgi:hypothetical protein